MPGIDEPRDSPLNCDFHKKSVASSGRFRQFFEWERHKRQGRLQDHNLPDRYLREIWNLPVLSRLTAVFQIPNPIELSRSL